MRVTRVRLLVLNFRIPVYTALSSFSSRARLSSQHAGRSVNEKSSARTIQIIIISPLLFLYKRIYRAAKSSRDKIERDLSLAANSTLTIITEREREGPPFIGGANNIHSNIATVVGARWTNRPTFIIRAHAASFAAYWIIPGES